MIVDEEEGCLGCIPKLRRLSLLEYLLGVHLGIPKLERLTLLYLLSSPSIAHLKTLIKISRKSYSFSCLPKKVCKSKASLRIANLRNKKPGQKLRKTIQQRKGNFFSRYFFNSNQKTLNRCLKSNCMEHALKKNQIKKMIW